jgi:archaellum component FlaF (FlaF/FlaG flagellin family)
MKRIITTIALLMTLGSTLYAQLPTFEWRIENEQLTAANTYQFDVNLYNTGTTTFELRAGTIALFYNTSWVNGGTLTITVPSSGFTTKYSIVCNTILKDFCHLI